MIINILTTTTTMRLMPAFQNAIQLYMISIGLMAVIQAFYPLDSYVIDGDTAIIIYAVALGSSVIVTIWNLGYIRKADTWYMTLLWLITIACMIASLYYMCILKRDSPVSGQEYTHAIFRASLFAFGSGLLHFTNAIDNIVTRGNNHYNQVSSGAKSAIFV